MVRVTHPEEASDAEAAFGAAVRDRRTDLALTQEQVRRRLLDAHGIDLSKTAMIRLEQGKRPIRFTEVSALAQLLGIDLSSWGTPQRTEPELPPELYEARDPDRIRKIRSDLFDLEQKHDAIKREAAVAAEVYRDSEQRRNQLLERWQAAQEAEHAVRRVLQDMRNEYHFALFPRKDKSGE